jgi:hypothetical protein
VVGAYAIGQPLVQSPFLDPRLYKKLFGLLLLAVGLDMVTGFTDALRQRHEQGATPVERAAGLATPAHFSAPHDHVSHVCRPARGKPSPIGRAGDLTAVGRPFVASQAALAAVERSALHEHLRSQLTPSTMPSAGAFRLRAASQAASALGGSHEQQAFFSPR